MVSHNAPAQVPNPEYEHDFGDASADVIKRIGLILTIRMLERHNNSQNLPQAIIGSCRRVLATEIPLVPDEHIHLIPESYRNL
jgi:hypothetical protein